MVTERELPVQSKKPFLWALVFVTQPATRNPSMRHLFSLQECWFPLSGPQDEPGGGAEGRAVIIDHRPVKDFL